MIIHWSDCADILAEHKIEDGDIAMLKKFIASFAFQERQSLMSAMIAFPHRVPELIHMVREKVRIAHEFNVDSARDLLLYEAKFLATTG